MKKIVPFTKRLTFKTMIREVTDIEIKHTLSLNSENELEGDILVDGKYKMTDASIMEEEFHYKLPFVIAIDPKYDTSNLEVSISDFNFEIINEEDLEINVEIQLDNLEEKISTRDDLKIPVEIDEVTTKVDYDFDPLEKLEEEVNKNKKEELKQKESLKSTDVSTLFSDLPSNEETFSTYYVYIVSESDTLEGIMDKYKISREELSDYNDLDDIQIGTKLIIPCSND